MWYGAYANNQLYMTVLKLAWGFAVVNSAWWHNPDYDIDRIYNLDKAPPEPQEMLWNCFYRQSNTNHD